MYPPYVTRTTMGAANAPLERQRIVDSSSRSCMYARSAELLLQTPRDFEDAALALHFVRVLLARQIGDIFAEHENALIAPHLVFHARVEEIDHRGLVARELRVVFGVELLARRINVG